jgi:hypothetical protein
MVIRPCAEFRADFPDDMIEEDGEIVQFPGRAVAETMSEMLRNIRYGATAPEHQQENGWDFDVKIQKRTIWIQVSDLGDGFVLASKCYAGLLPRQQDEVVYAEVLTRLNECLAADVRFSNVRWQMRGDVLSGAPGAETPVAG